MRSATDGWINCDYDRRLLYKTPTERGRRMNIRISNKTTGAVLGNIGKDDLQFLIDKLEEESSHDTDYFIDLATVDILEEAGGSAELIEMLRGAVGDSDGIDIAWEST